MQLLIASCICTSGTSSKSGSPQPYTIYRANVLAFHTDINMPNRKVIGVGYSSLVEIAVTDSFYPELSAEFHRAFVANNNFPVVFEVQTTMTRDGKNMIIGFEKKPDTKALFDVSKKAA
jgi:hypothetical protein